VQELPVPTAMPDSPGGDVKPRGAVSLVDELRGIERAAEGALLLFDGTEGQTIEADAIEAGKAVLALVVSRLKQVRMVVRGTLDAEALLSGHNVTIGKAAAGEDRDLRLEPRRARRRS
jgi:hypothetical protein